MTILINLLISLIIVIAAHILTFAGLWVIFSLGFGGKLSDLGFKRESNPLVNWKLYFLTFALPFLLVLIAIYSSSVVRITVGMLAMSIIVGIWVHFAIQLSRD